MSSLGSSSFQCAPGQKVFNKEGEISRNQFFYKASESLCWEEQSEEKKDPVSLSIHSKNQSVGSHPIKYWRNTHQRPLKRRWPSGSFSSKLVFSSAPKSINIKTQTHGKSGILPAMLTGFFPFLSFGQGTRNKKLVSKMYKFEVSICSPGKDPELITKLT